MAGNHNYPPVEVWAGVECTVNRVADHFNDQLLLNGHHHRLDDLEHIAWLGVRTIRYPVLWERTAPKSLAKPDWHWTDQRLSNLKSLGINPIAGLTHHGSGPSYTSLADASFAEGLAQYAGMVARRYPWLTHYTPVNEPLTTARFSGLYGHWYPHKQSPLLFVQMLLNQCKATVLAMKQIRQVQPDALLVQTEDLGQTHSTPELAYQADFENSRRWLTYDLLCGKVNKGHPMYAYFQWLGIPDSEIIFFLENPCPPDILGVNHYLTSERFLDSRTDFYPQHMRGGNGRHAYVDTEAIRIPEVEVAGPYKLIRQVWERYKRPIAITEAHLGCTREEQLRWLHQIWQTAGKLREEGVDIRAVTGWSMLGSYDWDSLLTNIRGHYEPGLFDVRAPQPRPTALAKYIKSLTSGQPIEYPVLDSPGWWQRNDRWIGHCLQPILDNAADEVVLPARGRPILITGATGTLGNAFERICSQRGLSFILLNRQEMDISSAEQVEAAVTKYHPWAIINTAGYVRVEQAESEPEKCFRENVTGAAVLAEVCRKKGIRLLTYSSDLVFDGQATKPYTEKDTVHPQGVYGESKAEAEKQVMGILPSALVIRTSAFFGPWDEHNFLTLFLRSLQNGEPFDVKTNEYISPTYVPDLVHTSLDLLIDGEEGIWHLANQGSISWADFGRTVALQAGFDADMVETWYQKQLKQADTDAKKSTALSSYKLHSMPLLANAISRYVHECTLWKVPVIAL
ncbi:family 1 glycosylhydrolase [Rhodocytophaga aerolata]|uniref:dTDP-4-dehydrorhamnose reductase n=1 Tax=Rhodocytophaga aerolata TaxID=455078 RepID=A0ABT8RGC7_9BACT|nr:family 1 glycosylhydrolase [Rhodocytophaga aerolata]MDO1451156.1 family 1 glycosylhydrolase [Rhodocytophaga aerolata]